MLFVVRFTDAPNRADLRARFLEDHKAWLAANRQSVRAAGLLRQDEHDPPLGACWIVAGESRAAVEALLHGDPFWVQGLRASCEILHWSRAFPPEPVSI